MMDIALIIFVIPIMKLNTGKQVTRGHNIIADAWAGAEMQLCATKNVLKRSFPHISTHVHGPTNRPTDRRTDGRTDTTAYRDTRTHLKNKIK